MYSHAIQTRLFQTNESLPEFLLETLPVLTENSILAITSKIISLSQGQVIAKHTISKTELTHQQADWIADTEEQPYGFILTIKNNRLIASAGIDESNAASHYILYPNNVQQVAESVWAFLRRHYQLKHLGIIVTDSHTTPLCRGVTGISLAWCGFKPLYSYIGKQDLHHQPLRVTQINLTDALATTAVLMMGEGDESTPFCLLQDVPKISFVDRIPTQEEKNECIIAIEDDLYAPLLKGLSWRKGKHA